MLPTSYTQSIRHIVRPVCDSKNVTKRLSSRRVKQEATEGKCTASAMLTPEGHWRSSLAGAALSHAVELLDWSTLTRRASRDLEGELSHESRSGDARRKSDHLLGPGHMPHLLFGRGGGE